MKKLYLSLVAMSSAVTVVGTANAATATDSLGVSATITATCSTATSAVNFGAVASGSGAVTTGSVDVTCTSGTPYTIALNEGLYHDGTDRRISDGTEFLVYTLLDNGSTLPWGDGTLNGDTVGGTGTGAVQSYTVDAALTGAAVTPGTYTDTVTVTVTY